MMSNRHRILVTGIVAALMALPACGGGSDPAPEVSSSPAVPAAVDPLDGTAWTLGSLEDSSASVPLPAEGLLTLGFAEGLANGTAGCNTFRGSYEVDGSGLSLGELAVTQMACEPELMDVETTYLASLGAVDTFEVGADGEALTLTGGGFTLVFAAMTPASIMGVNWLVTTLATENALSGPIAGSEPTLKFGTDGIVSGTDGCNRYHGSYSVKGDGLSVGKLATTMMACPTAVSQQASDFTTALEGATTFALDGKTLTIFGEDGRMLLLASSEPTGGA